MNITRVTDNIIGAAIAIHRELGPGLLESAYAGCMAVELVERRLHFEQQVPIRVRYKQHEIDCAYRLDFLIERSVVVELKSVARLEPIFDAQLPTYLRLTGCRVGLLLNFNVPLLRNGIRRLVL